MRNIKGFNKVFDRDVTPENALEFMLSLKSTEEKILREYIISQLEIKYHLYGLTESIGYTRNCEVPLIQLLNDEEPTFWKKIMEKDQIKENIRITTDDVLTNKPKITIVWQISDKIIEQEETLKSTHKFSFIKKRKINKKIEQLNGVLEKAKAEMKTYEQPHNIFELA